MDAVSACPPAAELGRLAAGDVPEPQADALFAHLERCPSCLRAVLERAPADTLVELLGQARTTHDIGDESVVAGLVAGLSKLGRRARADAGDWDFLAPAERADEIGRLGPYRVLGVLGRGGMGVVFRAEDPDLERPVALKVMLPRLAASPAARQLFLREARAAAAVRHDHVVAIYQVGEDRGTPFLAMELLDGESLDSCLNRVGALPVADALGVGIQLAEGLAAAHDRGLVHGDVKPGNIWLEARGPGAAARVKLLDFGLTRSAADPAPGGVAGTPAYMAPEQAGGAAVDHRADLFSLGCVLYRLTTGVLPFGGDGTTHVLSAVAVTTPDPAGAVNPAVPAALSDLIAALMAKEPAGRPASARAVAERLRGLLGAPARAARPPRRGLAVAAGLAAALLVAAGVVFFLPAGNGTIRVEIDDPDTEVVLTKTGARITGADKKGDILVTPGAQAFTVKRGDLEFETTTFALKKGGAVTVRVEYLNGTVRVALADGTVLGARATPADPADPAAERRAAEWVLTQKGPFPSPQAEVTVRRRGSAVTVTSRDNLPADPFTVVGVVVGGISNDDLRRLAPLTRLESLNVGRTAVTAEGLAHVAGCTELKVLKMYDSGLAGRDTLPIVARFAKLEKVMIPGRDADAWAATLAKMPSLRAVNLYRSDVTDAGVAQLARLPRLEMLVLEDCVGITDAALVSLAGCKTLRRLVVFDQTYPGSRLTAVGRDGLRRALPDLEIVPRMPPDW